MSANTTHTANLTYTSDKVHAALTGREFWDYVAENLISAPAEITEFTNDGNRTNVSLKQTVNADMAPDAAKKFVKKDMIVTINSSWSPLSDGTADSTYTGEVQGMPVSFSGTQKLSPEGDASKIDTDINLTVKVPMFGGVIEGKAIEGMPRVFGKITRLLNDYLAQQG
ncbi:DUF2505 domain-containing protein [Corynebacterium sp. H78]|uniref:DUF2505 domain-containing protein n=1 Tax=Corynebacterium sp. H78 TaxID=3133417 RepID=UPI0030B76B2C